MPPFTKLPRPEGHVYYDYSPMSPPNWGIVPSDFHVFVYRDIKVALKALMQAAITIKAQRVESGTADLFSDDLYFRGQTEITERLLPSRLRGQKHEPEPRQRFSVDNPPKIIFNGVEFPSISFSGPDGKDPKEHFGDWYEKIEPMRMIEDSLAEVPDTLLNQRDSLELDTLKCASQVPSVNFLDPFRIRSVVKHYTNVPSRLLDVTTDPEVAAFFATGGSKPPPIGKIGMLWAIDLNFLTDLFSLLVTGIEGGLKISLHEKRDKWGDNKKMFEDYGILQTQLEFSSVELPFKRPQAQKARFLSLSGEDGLPLPAFTELAWWSIIERRSYACAFLHDGKTYENPDHNITTEVLLPEDKELSLALQVR